jgi:transcriptional regulator with XRE-family HTH domain
MLVKWLSEQRKRRGLTLVNLAEVAGFTHSTLSRIETQALQLSLFSTVRIMYALDLPWIELFTQGFVKEGLPVPEIYRTPRQPESDFPCFLFGDFDVLDTTGLLRRGVAPAIVKQLLSRFIIKHSPTLGGEKIDLLASDFYSFLHSPNEKDGLAREVLPDVDLRYPQKFSPDNLRNIYFSGGALTLLDLGRYVRYLREIKKMTQSEIAALVDLSRPAVGYFETNPGDRIKIEDLIRLDSALELNGELVIFAWRSAELYLGIHRIKTGRSGMIQPWQQHEIHFIEKLITASRLFQHHFPEDRSWLDWYRQESLNGFENIAQ